MQEQNDILESPVFECVFIQGSLNTHPSRVYELPVIEEVATFSKDIFNNLSTECIETDINPGTGDVELELPLTLQVAMDELRKCFQIAQNYKREIAEAKTTVKKNYLKKKNRKNSEYAEKIIIFINKYQSSRANVETQQVII
jgi:hypothetical protein